MKLHALSFVFLFLMGNTLVAQDDFRKQAPQPGPPPKILMGDYQEFQLQNGLRVIVVENHKLPKVSFQLLMDFPLVKEQELAGVGDLTGQMLARGTKNRSKSQIDETVDFIGASLIAGSSGIAAAALSRHREKLLEVMSDMLLNPTFPEEEFAKLKKQTLSGIVSSKDDANTISANVSSVVAFGKDHPYGELTTEKSVETIKIEHCKIFYDSYFRPEISYLVMVGDITLKDAKLLANRYFAGWRQGNILAEQFDTPQTPSKPKVAFVQKTGAVQSVINITFPVELTPGHPDAIKASVMNTLFGGYFSSRLNANVREDKGYSYGVSSSLSPDRYIAAFKAGGAVRNEVTDSTITEFLFEMERLKTEPVPAPELEMVKNVMNGSFARSLEQPENVARYALNIARYKLPKDYYATYLETLGKVTAQDVMAMAQKYLLSQNAWIVVVGNADVAPKLERFDGEGKVQLYDYFGNPLDNQHTLMPDGVNALTILEDYLASIGGRENLDAVTDMTLHMKAEVQGMAIQSISHKKAPGKMLTSITASGMTLNQVKCDGARVEVTAMGQKQPMDEAATIAAKRQALLFPELSYDTDGFTLVFKGIEDVDGIKTYRVDVNGPGGDTSSDYFDMESGLKIRSVTTEGENVVISDFSDYRPLGKIKIPYKVKLSGAMPITVSMEVEKAAINEGLDDSLFIIK